MTSNDRKQQRKTVQDALEAGINWFDTAATYGDGQSETNLGAALRERGGADKVHVATKVRLTEQQLDNIGDAVKSSVAASMKRLGRSRLPTLNKWMKPLSLRKQVRWLRRYWTNFPHEHNSLSVDPGSIALHRARGCFSWLALRWCSAWPDAAGFAVGFKRFDGRNF